jgi:hypothetical protein
VVADLPGDRVARRERSLAGTWAPRLVALVFAAALATVVVLAVLAVVTGLAIWLFWMVVAWWLFGHRHRTGGPWGHHPAPHRRPWY